MIKIQKIIDIPNVEKYFDLEFTLDVFGRQDVDEVMIEGHAVYSHDTGENELLEIEIHNTEAFVFGVMTFEKLMNTEEIDFFRITSFQTSKEKERRKKQEDLSKTIKTNFCYELDATI